MPPSTRSILEELRRRHTDEESARYLQTHGRRYEVLAATVEGLVAPLTTPAVLDVGPAYQTEIFRRRLPNAVVDTLGWADARFPPRPGERHVELDLNDLEGESRWPRLREQDAVVLAEVVEHLYTAPVHVLRALAACLRPGGHLVLQTPNAAALFKRLKLFAGRNPFEPIRERRSHPGHFREYTVAELLALAPVCGLEVREWRTDNYFEHGSRKHRAFVALSPAVPRRLRDGITLVYARSGAPPARA